MRLLRLKIKNIASLKGEHEVDFLEIQKISPLFAITGETGAGKSSILNSIGLALYGEIYKKNINQLDVVTLGEKDGSIELIFQVKDKYYLADWRARVLKQNGEPYSTPQSPTRNLYRLDGTEFSSPKTISNLATSELLNLDFDQFCRCIILNQGEFAKFLNSSFKDRRDILEKLYPGEMLDNMSKELETEKKALEKSKHDLEIELHTLRGDSVSGDVLKDQKKDLEAQLKNLEEQNKVIEELNYHFVSLFTYHEKFSDNEAKKLRIKADMAIETTKYNLLLKDGEVLQEKYHSVKKKQETELPHLQTYLAKEESLKHLEEGNSEIKKALEETSKKLEGLKERNTAKEAEEKSAEEKLSLALAQLKLPLSILKAGHPHFAPLFDLFGENELLQEELKGKSERLSQLEVTGKELKNLSSEIETKIKGIPSNVKDLVKNLEKKKADLTSKIEEKQRALITSQELKKTIDTKKIELENLSQKITLLRTLIGKTKADMFPLETTLKLQEVLNAKELCVDHALKEKKSTCPVCEQNVSDEKWQDLKAGLAATDLQSIRTDFEKKNELLFKTEKESEHDQAQLKKEIALNLKREEDWQALASLREEALPTINDLELALNKAREDSWQWDAHQKDLDRTILDLQKTRDHYGKLKAEVTEKQKIITAKETLLSELCLKLIEIIPVVTRDSIRDLKTEERHLKTSLELEGLLERVQRDKKHLLEEFTRLRAEASTFEEKQSLQTKKISDLRAELTSALKGEKASALILAINQSAKVATEAWNRQTEEQKKQELILKDSQGRLYQLGELTKDYDQHYFKELHTLKEMAANSHVRPELKRLKDLALDFTSPRELFIPLKDLLFTEKETTRALTNECRMNFASMSTRLTDWEKLQDKIQILEMRSKDINEALARKMRLFEVLGKDELRTFVLSLVEENLIAQTNDELQKLCQGRYEIVHQIRSLKMTPEFYILDKFREGGKRKVSTLSGGETFMVSLAMALGLAEMTRGQAEIDSLFIDEGFGTLDQESLEDVLDMLQQIQTRGLMVGIISHIKTLTSALPVNLALAKRSDGTSSIGLILN